MSDNDVIEAEKYCDLSEQLGDLSKDLYDSQKKVDQLEKENAELKELAKELWFEYLEHDRECCEKDRPDLMKTILKEKNNDE